MKTPYFFSLFIIFFALLSILKAQPAPDFLVTDTEGKQHQLYQDYLNQGKTVVIKMFFVDCPPCNAMAPLMEPLYQNWGAGQYDVEFFSMSIMPNDSNQKIEDYKTTYGQTFPGVGNTGGSLTALIPYRDGTYGFFIGTPTFVVIAPDGTVTFDPRGPNKEATISMVDQAIAQTGAILPPLAFTGSGLVETYSNKAIPNTSILFNGSDSVAAVTNSEGQFTIDLLLDREQSYTLSAQRDTSFKEGLSVLDIIKIRKHILNLELLDDPYQLIAADLNGNGSVSTLDVIKLVKIVLNLEDDVAGRPSWVFINKDYVFLDPQNPFPEVEDGSATQIDFSINTDIPFSFWGIKLGDVNFDIDLMD